MKGDVFYGEVSFKVLGTILAVFFLFVVIIASLGDSALRVGKDSACKELLNSENAIYTFIPYTSYCQKDDNFTNVFMHCDGLFRVNCTATEVQG